MNFLEVLGIVDYLLIFTAFGVAVLGLFSRYKLIPAILLSEYCIMIGFETMAVISCCETIPDAVNYHLIRSTIMLIFFLIYLNFNSKFQTYLSLLCVIYLTYITLLTNYNIIAITDSLSIGSDYEVDVILAVLYAIRLFVCLLEVLNGYGLLNDYRRMFNHFWRGTVNRDH